GDFFVIFGPSGCGKSTLLHVVLGLEEPEKGQVELLGQNLYLNKTEDEKAEFRKKHIGVVYQQTYWIRSLTVLQNTAFPLQLLGQEKNVALSRAMQMLEEVEMAGWADYIPTELSSGQQQRVNLARAMINDPEILVTDEPTGNLDYESGQELMKLMADLNQRGKTIVMVTHDLEFLNFATKAAEMKDGQIGQVYLGQEKQNLFETIKKKKFDYQSKPGLKK
ncbi:MAG: ATP-binding cassette domain-containing protein, partial [Candidatus Pacebacteria bacterium]|nr:ATP-binding cassette domain-containing protein [Candidatus Paceibacterota bacterium]